MDIPRKTRYPLHGRAKLALPDHRVLEGKTQDIGEGGVCFLLDEQISIETSYPICFELFVSGKNHIITASAKAVYGVFSSHGGFRVGLQFSNSDSDRTRLIKSLGGSAPKAHAPEHKVEEQVAPPPSTNE
jgi:hypothetical protein